MAILTKEFDNDTHSVFQQQIDFIQKSGIVMAVIGMFQASPGTKLHKRLSQENRVLGQISRNSIDGGTNIIPNMRFDVLWDGYKKILGRIYSPRHFYHRLKSFFREYKSQKTETPQNFEHIPALFRSVSDDIELLQPVRNLKHSILKGFLPHILNQQFER